MEALEFIVIWRGSSVSTAITRRVRYSVYTMDIRQCPIKTESLVVCARALSSSSEVLLHSSAPQRERIGHKWLAGSRCAGSVCWKAVWSVCCLQVVGECALKGLTELCQQRSERLGMTKKRREENCSGFHLFLLDLSPVYKKSTNNCKNWLHREVSGDWTRVIKLDQKYLCPLSYLTLPEWSVPINSAASPATGVVTAEVHSYACVRIFIAAFLLPQNCRESKHLTEQIGLLICDI